MTDSGGGFETFRVCDVECRHLLGANPREIAGVAAVIAPDDDHQVDRGVLQQGDHGVLAILRKGRATRF